MRIWRMGRQAPEEGQTIGVTDARGAITGTGTIWVLIISTTLAVLVLLGLWALNSRDLLNLDQGSSSAGVAEPATRTQTE